jgi:CBS domain-containing protein
MLCPACGSENIDGTDRCDNCLTPFRDLDVPHATAGEGLARSVMEDKLSKLGYDDPVCVKPDTPAYEVVRLMKENHCGCALVVENGKLVGIFTEHDVLLKMTPETRAATGATEEVLLVQSEVAVLPAERLLPSDLPLSEIPVEELRSDEFLLREPTATGQSTFGQSGVKETTLVKDLMTPNPETLRENETVAFALNMMSLGRYRHLPVQKDDGSYTVASIKNVLNYIAKADW